MIMNTEAYIKENIDTNAFISCRIGSLIEKVHA